MNDAAPELPRYLCHKEVQAARITGVEWKPGEKVYVLHLDGGVQVKKHPAWQDKFGATVGSYYVVYKDGYSSVSPAQAFEEGYTRVGA